MKKEPKMIPQTRLREIAWEIGSHYPIPFSAEYIALYMVSPHQAHVHWHLRSETLDALHNQSDTTFKNAPLVVRVYDITDVLFDGFNAHSFFDIEAHSLTGNYYFSVPQLARNYLAEIGLRGWGGSFRYLARSEPVFFERDRPSGNYQVHGLFVGGALKRKFAVENIFDASIYEQMNRQLPENERQETLSVAMVFLGLSREAVIKSPLGASFSNFPQKFEKFESYIQLFTPFIEEEAISFTKSSLFAKIDTLSEATYNQVKKAHQHTPFHLLHCHDWYSSKVGFMAAKDLQIPVILSLHSTEYERTHGYEAYNLSADICEWEQAGVQAANLVIVPHSSTRQQIISLYGASPEKVVIIPDVFEERSKGGLPNSSDVRRWFNIPQDLPVVLFAGEISHATGADLLMDAIPQVSHNHKAVFVFVGEGPLKGELEARAWHSGLGHHCRFVGDVSRKNFEALLLASDFVVIPARTWQDEGLAQMAIGAGKAVLTTHQAGIHCVVHGQNGLITYDNPGSIVWGVQELLTNPLQGHMLRLVARKKANQSLSIENVVVQHYMYYEIVLKNLQGEQHA